MTNRKMLLPALVVCAVLIAVPAFAFQETHQTIPQSDQMQMPQQSMNMEMSPAAGQLKTDMRKLWTDHVVWTRDFIIASSPKATLVDLMNQHLATTTKEVQARLAGKWDDDVRAFNDVYNHILKMSDALSDGIVKQFPEKFAMAQSH